MLKKLKRALPLALLMTGTAGVAHAEGWYARGDLGYSVGGGLDIENVEGGYQGGNNGPFGGDTDHEDNWMGSVGIGRAWENGFRLEGELAYRENELDPTPTVERGETTATSLMVNAYWDFNRDGGWQPYVGVGVGAAEVEASASRGDPVPPPFDFIGFDEKDTGFAYQAMVGVNIPMSERLSLDLGYRYFAAPDLEYDGVYTTDSNTLDDIALAADYDHHAVTLGIRWQFSAPAAAPVVAPPPPPPPQPIPPPAQVCPTSEFIVYFEWDRSNLNQAALETIDAAVTRARQCNIGGVVIVGHTDTSGSAAYNQGLSERRAGVVRDALVARGIPTAAVTTQARGETDLARATRDGVREPLNRRTAVTIRFR
jgi:OOP family OmpA-OmpF porin